MLDRGLDQDTGTRDTQQQLDLATVTRIELVGYGVINRLVTCGNGGVA